MDDKTYFLGAHRVFSKDKVNSNNTRIMAHNEKKEGQIFRAKLIYKGIYDLHYDDHQYSMFEWSLGTISVDNKVTPVFSSSSNKPKILVKFQKAEKENELYYMIDVSSDNYFFIDKDCSRDEYSYFINFTQDKEKASKFKIQKNDRR